MKTMTGYVEYNADGWQGQVLESWSAQLPPLEKLIYNADEIVNYPDREVKRIKLGRDVFYIKIFRTVRSGMSVRRRIAVRCKAFFRKLRSFHTLEITSRMLQMGFLCPETVLAAKRCCSGELAEILIIREIRFKTVGKLLAEAANPEKRKEILRDCAVELRRFHEAGIVHGDCLPLNLCMDENRRLCFIDNDRTRIYPGLLRRRQAERNLIQFASHCWLDDTPYNLQEATAFLRAYLGEEEHRLEGLLMRRYRRIEELACEVQRKMMRNVSSDIISETMRSAGAEEGVRFWASRTSPLRDEDLRQAVLHGYDSAGSVVMKENRRCCIHSVNTKSGRVVVRKFTPRAEAGPFVMDELANHLALRRLGLPAPALYGYFRQESGGREKVQGIVVEYMHGSRALRMDQVEVAASMLGHLFALGVNHADFTRSNILYNESTGAVTIISLHDSRLVGLRNVPSLLMQAQRYIEMTGLPMADSLVQHFIQCTYDCIGDLPFSREAFSAALEMLLKRHHSRRERCEAAVPKKILKLLGGRWK